MLRGMVILLALTWQKKRPKENNFKGYTFSFIQRDLILDIGWVPEMKKTIQEENKIPAIQKALKKKNKKPRSLLCKTVIENIEMETRKPEESWTSATFLQSHKWESNFIKAMGYLTTNLHLLQK